MTQLANVMTRSFAAKPTIIDLRTACVAHYKMNDNTASATVVDSQGFSNGTAQQNTSSLFTTGKVGGALTFNGTSDYIDTGNTFQSVFQRDFSVNLWFKTNDGMPPDVWYLFETYTAVDAVLITMYGGDVGADCTINGNTAPGCGGIVFGDGPQDWAMVTATFHQIDETGNFCLSLYFNGSFLDDVVVDDIILANYTSSTNVHLGHYIDSEIHYYYSGLIDNVMIFNKVLSTDEIAFLWNGGNGTEYLNGVR